MKFSAAGPHTPEDALCAAAAGASREGRTYFPVSPEARPVAPEEAQP